MSSEKNTSLTDALDQPVFITGIPRSGTTLLYSILLSHSSFKPELADNPTGRMAESKAFTQIKNFTDSESVDRYLLNNTTIKSQFLDSVSRIRRYQKIGNKPYFILQKLPANAAIRKLIFKLGLNHKLLRSYFYHAKLARGVNRIVEKTPNHIKRLPEIWATFPDAKCIFLYRHPVDVFSSFRKRLKLAQQHPDKSEKSDWLNLTTEEFSRLYESLIRTALHATIHGRGDNLMLLKYEDLTAQPYACLQNICSFINAPFEEQMIPDKESQGTAKYSGHIGGKIVTKTKQWQDTFSRDEAKLLEDKLSEILNTLQYQRYT